MTRFQTIRTAKGLSRKVLAKKLSTHPSTIATWDSGRSKPREEKIPKLAKLFGISELKVIELVEEQANQYKVARRSEWKD